MVGKTLKFAGKAAGGRLALVFVLAIGIAGCQSSHSTSEDVVPPWEAANPVTPIPAAPLGTGIDLAGLPTPPTPERVRLGRWLFYDKRLSVDGTVACATCHRPENAFSEPTPVSTGVGGQKGKRKAPTFINQAVTFYPNFFWDGRAGSLEQQALGPIANPIEMANTHTGMVTTLSGIEGYRPYFAQAFGSDEITKERVAHAIADYERTRMSGNSPWDRWRLKVDSNALSEQARLGNQLFFNKAGCSQCHVGNNLTDYRFHNTGVGWNPATKQFSDEGRYETTSKAGGSADEADRGAFKTPTLREVTKRAPYMHDGSVPTLREVVELYNRGGHKNPHLDARMEPLKLTEEEIDALVAFMQALEGEGYQDSAPARFPE